MLAGVCTPVRDLHLTGCTLDEGSAGTGISSALCKETSHPMREPGVVSRNHLKPTDQKQVPFTLLSSTFWVDKHQQWVGVRNWNNLTGKRVSYMEWCVQTCCQKQRD